MNRICKVILAAAAVTALAAPAMAADKLIVRNAGNTADAFKVDDTGSFSANGMKFDATAMRLGLGTANPQASFHNLETTGTNAQRGGMFTQINDGNQAATIVFQKAFGTELIPKHPWTVTANSAYIGAFVSQYWNGQQYDRSAQFGFRLEGTPTLPVGDPVTTPGNFPTAIVFFTGSRTLPSSDMVERFRVSSDGRLRLTNQPAAPAAASACTAGDLILDAPNGFLYLCTASGAWKRATFAAY